MPFKPVQSEKISLAVVRQIELLILRGILRPGDKLPAERDLAETMAVSRPSLRVALGDLQDRGLLESRQGAGVFVADVLGSAFSDALIDLFARHPEAVQDTVAFRRDIEALAAERATRLASDTDLKVIDAIFQKMLAAHERRDADHEAQLDSQFHLAIVEAGHNIIMLHMMRSMYELLRGGVFYNRQVIFRQRTRRQALLDQHAKINTAIQSRDPLAARAAIEAHLDFVEQALNDQRRAQANEEIAQARLDYETRR